MPWSSAYLFLELSILVYAIGFGWENWRIARLRSRTFLFATLGLAIIWFVLDQVAVRLGLWTFPLGGSLPVRLLSLPIEEYVLFFLHTIICLLFVRQYSQTSQ